MSLELLQLTKHDGRDSVNPETGLDGLPWHDSILSTILPSM